MSLAAYSYIRFSSSQQAKGDSYRRQIKATEEYCEEHNLKLSELSFNDFGISAYKGQNHTEGTLRKFIEACEESKIEPGSTLIVESLDRLSRDTVSKFMRLLLDIIDLDITIVTLINKVRLNKKIIDKNPQELFYVLGEMVRANNESHTKSIRVKKAFDNRVQKARENGTAISKICPAWLEIRDNRYQIIEGRDIIIKDIFKKYIDGFGVYSIAEKLNTEGVHVWGRGSKWHRSYIRKILANRAVLGEYQPHIIKDGKRIPNGEVIRKYYPKIITPNLYDKVQLKLSQNKHKGGRTGKCTNLFTHIAKCGYCGSSMVCVDKGNNLVYQVCSAARNSKYNNDNSLTKCHYISLNNTLFEEAFKKHCKELNISEIVNDTSELQQNINDYENKLEYLNLEYNHHDKIFNNAKDELLLTENERIKEEYRKSVENADIKKNEVAKEIKQIKLKIDELKTEEEYITSHMNSINKLNKKLKSAKGEELINIRRKLKDTIRKTVSKITFYNGNNLNDANFPNKPLAYCVVEYKSGKSLAIQNTNSKDEPFRIDLVS